MKLPREWQATVEDLRARLERVEALTVLLEGGRIGDFWMWNRWARNRVTVSSVAREIGRELRGAQEVALANRLGKIVYFGVGAVLRDSGVGGDGAR